MQIYMDADMAYLAGMVASRGVLSESGGVRKIAIEFPHSALEIQGQSTLYDQQKEIRLGLQAIRDRLVSLLEPADISILHTGNQVSLVIKFLHPSIVWRNLMLLFRKKTSYRYFHVPDVFFEEWMLTDWKLAFVRGFADVSGNIRHANRYVDRRHRVRIDILNYRTNWQTPVQLCTLLQEHLEIPVQLITWGHPNLGRGFREHQLNIFAVPFLKIGFSFEHKQALLEEFAQEDREQFPNAKYLSCPGLRQIRKRKPSDPAENNKQHLDPRLLGNHYDSYFEICHALGCKRRLELEQAALEYADTVEAEIEDQA